MCINVSIQTANAVRLKSRLIKSIAASVFEEDFSPKIYMETHSTNVSNVCLCRSVITQFAGILW